MSAPSVQERWAPTNACFGCGPANSQGLRIRSFPTGGPAGELACDWTPQPHHAAFPGILNGGIVGALLDCHMNWTAVMRLKERDALDSAPCCVTSEFSVKLTRPTPTDGPVRLVARVVEEGADRAVIESELSAGGKVCARGRGTFVSVKPTHPAYHRW
ncbi:MAG: thioesterase superfamily protein [Elusimicrobia bacterium]|nr:MAG: thioesterase superfamily protein [Elusimicrobiota bacterium]